MHHLTGNGLSQVRPCFHQSAQVTICENTLYVIVVAHNGSGPQAFLAHLAHQLPKAGAGPHPGNILTRAHHIAYVGEQFPPQRTAGVRPGKVFRLEATRIQQRNRQRVSQRQLRCRAGGRGQIQGASFLFNTTVQQHICIARQG